MQKNTTFTLIFIFFTFYQFADGQSIDSSSFEIFPRLSFYTSEKKGEFLLHVPATFRNNILSVSVLTGEDTLARWEGKPGKGIIRIPFSLNFKPSDYRINANILPESGARKEYCANTTLTILRYKSNEVKTDKLTGGLIVNKLPFFPFGFYCYSPVDPKLPEEEAVNGFNMISPYQKIMPETFSERKAYMDRCAQIGMKVHYNLLSVSGGGGVSSRIPGLEAADKKQRLINEVIAFRDHPALLGWYIADEPNGYKIPPAELEGIYRTVRELDPWHPVSIVFMAPFLASKKYMNAFDVVMADPYPLPDLPASMTGNVAGQLREEFSGKRPVWMVPQAFGGGELWSREPTMQEIRLMTWQSIIRGATGIQYFVRQGPNYFPKSAATWNECGRIAMEVAELTPWLLSDEEPLAVESSSKDVVVTSRLHDGQLAVMAVNIVNQPVVASIKIDGALAENAKVIFENRSVPVKGGMITDYIGAFGTQVYLIEMKNEKTKEKTAEESENINLIRDAGFEDLSSPGIPSACYARPGGDRGATYFLDTREHHEGTHSLRLITPETDKAVTLRFFPFKVKPGATYIVSVWAKADPEQQFRVKSEQMFRMLPGKPIDESVKISEPQYVDVMIGDFHHVWFVPGKEWKQYVTFVTIPRDSSSQFRTNLSLRMAGQGVAWFDQIRVFEEKAE